MGGMAGAPFFAEGKRVGDVWVARSVMVNHIQDVLSFELIGLRMR